MSEISAYMGLVQLRKLDAMVQHRQNCVDIIAKIKAANISYCRPNIWISKSIQVYCQTWF